MWFQLSTTADDHRTSLGIRILTRGSWGEDICIRTQYAEYYRVPEDFVDARGQKHVKGSWVLIKKYDWWNNTVPAPEELRKQLLEVAIQKVERRARLLKSRNEHAPNVWGEGEIVFYSKVLTELKQHLQSFAK
jgi:hypothetical protein